MQNTFGVDLDLLAYDIADLLDRNEYGLDLTQDDVRAALPGFLRAARASARRRIDGDPVADLYAARGCPQSPGDL